MINNKLRAGNVTNSVIHNLIPFGARPMTEEELDEYKKDNPGSRAKTTKCPLLFQQGGLTLIETKVNERRMGRSFDVNQHSQSTAWGEFMETVVYSLLGPEYKTTNQDTKLHPTIDGWAGTGDALKYKGGKPFANSEVKCYWPKEFARIVNVILQEDLELFKKEFKEEYWQIVGGACIAGVTHGEIVVYMPYASEMENKEDKDGNVTEFGIRHMIENYDGYDQWKYRFIYEKENWELPVLPDGGYYKNLNKFLFKIPKEDIELLEQRVKLAVSIIKKRVNASN
jgi:hypothetical protein